MDENMISDNLITDDMVSAVNKIASDNGKNEKPAYEMRHIPNKWMIFEYSEWCYMPLKNGLKSINEAIKKPLDEYGLTDKEINAYKELLLMLEIEINSKAVPKK